MPFNVKDINGAVYVTYAPSGHAAQTGAAKGMGALAVFSEDGTLESSSFVADELASPWGLALAPGNWGQFGGDLLVGNFAFGDSVIDALDPTTWALEGTIAIDDGGQSPAVSGRWLSAAGAMTETRRRCSSPTVSTARRMASWRRSPPFPNRRPGR